MSTQPPVSPDSAPAGGDLPYKNAALSTRERVRDLLSRMTLEEKAAQMVGVWQKKAETLVDAAGVFDLEKARAAFGEGHGLGQVGRPSDAGGSGVGGGGHDPKKGRSARQQAELTNAIQRFFLEESRLGIPVIFHEECLHGQAAIDATSFSQPIGLAATFNPQLVEALYSVTAEEARVRGTHQALTPVVDVARDPRWGRVEETFGEDPYLVSRMGIAAVRGFQGDATFRDRRHLIATLKHFVAHGQPEGGQNCAPTSGRKPAGPLPKCSSGISIRAVSCRLPSRAPPDTCRRSTTINRPRGAAISGMTLLRSSRSASVSATPAFRWRTSASRGIPSGATPRPRRWWS
jgi:hypothetical protein